MITPSVRHGTDQAGFEVTVDHLVNTVSIRMWGFWTPELCDRYTESFAEAIVSVPSGSSSLMLDLSLFVPQKDETQQALMRTWKLVQPRKLRAIAIIAQNPLTRLQIRRLCQEGELARFEVCNTEDAARVVLARSKRA